MLSVNERLEANAIIDRLVKNEDTFSENDALRLIEIIPAQKVKNITFGLGFFMKGGKFRGKAAGIGDVEMEREPINKEWSSDNAAPHKIGGYEVLHTPGWISIALMWEDSKLDQTGLSCQLEYDRASRIPRSMQIAEQKTFKVPFLPFYFKGIHYVPWKEPRKDVPGSSAT